MNLLKLEPAFKDYLWGGTKLRDIYKKKCDYDKVAESWELSTHKDGSSIIVNGDLAGTTFIDYLEKEGKAVWGSNAARFDKFPILIKFIDAKQPLSIQVHPDNEYALRVEGEYGKNEVWYILDCEEGSFLYFGVKEEMTQEQFRERIENNTILDYLNKVEVHKGDVFFIKAGTIHAIGAGQLICEIQQNSNTTYRVYDFGRVDANGNPRELHVDKSIDVSTLVPSEKTYGQQEKVAVDGGHTKSVVADCEYFASYCYNVKDSITFTADETSFNSIIILEGEGTITCGDESATFVKGDSFFLPAGAGEYTINATCDIIRTTV